MESINQDIKEYTDLLRLGRMQKAYRSIIAFMAGMRIHLENKYGGYTITGLYQGYMDMTFFTFTPNVLKDRNLKIAIVYLHEEARFALWLTARNRKMQMDYIDLFSNKNIGIYTLSKPEPGVDAILSIIIENNPDFDNSDELRTRLEIGTIKFIEDTIKFLE